jgi:post-segregation antitoxin (ccd killing protein)
MPLMAPEKKTTNEQLNVTLPADTLRELRAYAQFLNQSSVSYVLTQLITILIRDKEFQQWKTEHQAELSALAAPSPKNGAKPGRE